MVRRRSNRLKPWRRSHVDRLRFARQRRVGIPRWPEHGDRPQRSYSPVPISLSFAARYQSRLETSSSLPEPSSNCRLRLPGRFSGAHWGGTACE